MMIAHTERASIDLDITGVHLPGDLRMPDLARGLVLFAHGSGSNRASPRNQQVAETLQEAGLATLLFDLVTPEEDEADHRFDLPLLAGRLVAATDWAARYSATAHLPVAYYGASTGAAAAFLAAAQRPGLVYAIVSRGGRPDLASEVLPRVDAPTLLIVGGRDDFVLELNRRAFARMRAPRRLEIVPGASHLFPEPGAMEEVGRLARLWLAEHVVRAQR
jgi:putative phosphoribosyl transferase